MGPWLVLVSPCFRKNVVATCKIGSFLCSLDNLLQKNVVVLFFGNQVLKWHSFKERAIFDQLFTFFSHQGKVTKISSSHISLTYIHVECSILHMHTCTNACTFSSVQVNFPTYMHTVHAIFSHKFQDEQ